MITGERRSGIDTRSEAQKQLIGERRSRIERRESEEPRTDTPSSEHLALFTRRLRRVLRDERGRGFFGVANGESDFALYPDVVRVVEWLDRLSGAGQQSKEHPKPSLRKAIVSEPGAVLPARRQPDP
jgi:hypothetical protein